MVWLLHKCTRCSAYTLHEDACPRCGGELKSPHPAKFSMEDRFRGYRLTMRRLAEKQNAS